MKTKYLLSIAAIAIQAKQQNEAFILQQLRLANDDVQARIARILAGRE